MLPDAIQDLAQAILTSGGAGTVVEQHQGVVNVPLPIRTPDGEQTAWLVGVAIGDRLAGFFVFGLDGQIWRYSSFLSERTPITDCPAMGTWLSPDHARQRADRLVLPSEAADDPFLSFDTSPERIAWAVRTRDRVTNAERLIFVAGDYAYVASGEGGGITGGPPPC